MKVKDLILALQKLDPELMVIVDGYEGGVREAEEITEKTIALKVNAEWYYGEHEEIDVMKDGKEINSYDGHERAKAVLID